MRLPPPVPSRVDLLDRIVELEAQVAGLEAMNTEKADVIRRLRMGNHPAGRALRATDAETEVCQACREGVPAYIAMCTCPVPADNVVALREALTERDAEHEGCDCTELCSMGPTCPGGMLARFPGSGCWRTDEGGA